MDDEKKTRTQLLDEVASLRRQLKVLHRAQLEAKSVIATVRAPLVILSADLHVLSANRAFYQTFQVSPEETEQQLLYDLGNGQWNIPALRHLLEALLPIGLAVYDFEVTHQFPSVGRKVMLLNAQRIDDDHPPSRVLLAIEDITERQRAACLLQQQRDGFSGTLRSIGDAVLATDMTAALTFMNPEAERLTGWTLQEALGRDVSDVLILRDEGTQLMDNPIRRALQEGHVVGLTDRPFLVSRDGKEIPIADSCAPICHVDGTLHGAVMVFRDITEQVKLDRLLVQEKERAEAADQTKSEFLATMSHELRTPLSVILGYTALMSEGEFGAVTEKARTILGRVRQSASALLELVTAMLDLSRLEAGRLPVYMQDVWIPTLLDEIKGETREICEQAALEVVWQVEGPLPPLRTDGEKLKTVIKNLLGNALKFTPQGRITVEVQSRAGGVEFCVTDTGIGMPRSALALIFEPFRQVAENGEGSRQGTGLGLHIVKRFMEMLGGTVAVESEVGHGSTFRVWAPSGGAPSARTETVR